MAARAGRRAADADDAVTDPDGPDAAQWDALTTFGVRIWKPEVGAWREVSVHGGVHEPRARADVAAGTRTRPRADERMIVDPRASSCSSSAASCARTSAPRAAAASAASAATAGRRSRATRAPTRPRASSRGSTRRRPQCGPAPHDRSSTTTRSAALWRGPAALHLPGVRPRARARPRAAGRLLASAGPGYAETRVVRDEIDALFVVAGLRPSSSACRARSAGRAGRSSSSVSSGSPPSATKSPRSPLTHAATSSPSASRTVWHHAPRSPSPALRNGVLARRRSTSSRRSRASGPASRSPTTRRRTRATGPSARSAPSPSKPTRAPATNRTAASFFSRTPRATTLRGPTATGKRRPAHRLAGAHSARRAAPDTAERKNDPGDADGDAADRRMTP